MSPFQAWHHCKEWRSCCLIKSTSTPLRWTHPSVSAAITSYRTQLCGQRPRQELRPCEVFGTRFMSSVGNHAPSLPREEGGVLGRVPDICVQYSGSPLITHNSPHTHPYTRTHISKMLECGEMCERGFLGHLSAHWDRSCPGNGAVQCESQSCWVLHLLPLMFCIYGSWSSSCFDVFSPNSSWKDRRECETQTSITGRRLNLFSEGQTKRRNRSMLFPWSHCSRFPVTKHRDPVTLGETVQTHSLHHTFTLLLHVSRG